MKVIYEADQLGAALLREGNRTGIFRVIYNVAHRLAVSPELEIQFCSTDNFYECYQFIENDKILNNIPVVFPNFREGKQIKAHGDLLRKEEALTASINKTGGSGISQKLYRKILAKIREVATKPTPTFSLANIKPFAQADIYHSPFTPIPAAVKDIKGLQKFLTVYDLIPILYPQYFQNTQDHIVNRAIKSISQDGWAFAISHATKNDLCEYSGMHPDRVFVTHLAADPEIFYPFPDQEAAKTIRQKYNIPDAPYFLSLSTLEPRKNIDHVIRTFAQLVQAENLQDVYLVLVGTKGWDFDKIFAEIARNSWIKSRIIVTGFVPDEDLAAIYTGALGFLYLSLYEGFGLPPLEAMQCGVPVITSDNSSLPEVVGEAGLQVNAHDADALAQGMLRIYNDAGWRQQMAQKSLTQANKFSWDKCVQDTIKGYKTALNI